MLDDDNPRDWTRIRTLDRILMGAMADLPVRHQVAVLREENIKILPSAGLPLTGPPSRYASGDADAEWLEAHAPALATGLLRHRGLDPDDVAVLSYLRVIPHGLSPNDSPGPEPVPTAASVRFRRAGIPDTSLTAEEIAVATGIIDALDKAFEQACDDLGLELGSDRRPIEVRIGLVEALAKGGAATLGVLLLSDVFTGGATLPLTAPLYTKILLGSGLLVIPAISFSVSTANTWAGRQELIARTEKNRQEARRADAEIANLNAQKSKTETETLSPDVVSRKSAIELALAEAQLRKAQLELEEKELDIVRKRIEGVTQRQLSREFALLEETARHTKVAGKDVELEAPAAALPRKEIEKAASRFGLSVAEAAHLINVGVPHLQLASLNGLTVEIGPHEEQENARTEHGIDNSGRLDDVLTKLAYELGELRKQRTGGLGSTEGSEGSEDAAPPGNQGSDNRSKKGWRPGSDTKS